MEKTKAMVTINWRGKEKKRGLTEKAIETLRKASVKAQRPNLMEDADKLDAEYEKTKEVIVVNGVKQVPIFTFEKELEMVKQYVRVRL